VRVKSGVPKMEVVQDLVQWRDFCARYVESSRPGTISLGPSDTPSSSNF
jgi:hypothetical protein